MIRHLVAPHRLFEQSRLRVGAIQHRGPPLFALLRRRLQVLRNRVGDEQRFVFAVGRFVVAELRPALPLGPKLLPFAVDVVRHHRRCGGQDVLRGPVVLLQPDDLGVGEVAFELQDVADVRAPPRINRLVLVADRAHVVPLAREQPHQLVLRTVRVLVLIHQQIMKAPVVVMPHRFRDFQQPHRFQQQVVEIHRVRFAQLLPVDLVDLRNLLRLLVAGVQVRLLRIEHVVLGPRNFRQHRARRELLVVHPQPPQRALHHLLLVTLVVNGKILRVPGVVDAQRLHVAPQHTHAHGVECRNPRLGKRAPADQFLHALRHLASRFVGEGDGQDGFRRGAQVLDQVRDAEGDDARLPRPGARQDEQRPLDGLHRFALLGI